MDCWTVAPYLSRFRHTPFDGVSHQYLNVVCPGLCPFHEEGKKMILWQKEPEIESPSSVNKHAQFASRLA